jgi:phage shock protein A
MAPLEAQIRQHKDQLKHRLASIQRIHDATDSLEQKIAAFESSQQALEAQGALGIGGQYQRVRH